MVSTGRVPIASRFRVPVAIAATAGSRDRARRVRQGGDRHPSGVVAPPLVPSGTAIGDNAGMRLAAPTATPTEVDVPTPDEVIEEDRPWVVIVWNDPINLMSYVTFVFQKLFGYSREKAEKLMLDVHLRGKAVVSQGSREKAELDVFRLHEHGLWATMEHDR
jgi:ATP-dependent Clp protease adaptor protein ClpS